MGNRAAVVFHDDDAKLASEAGYTGLRVTWSATWAQVDAYTGFGSDAVFHMIAQEQTVEAALHAARTRLYAEIETGKKIEEAGT